MLRSLDAGNNSGITLVNPGFVETGSRKRQSGPCCGRGHSPVFMEDQTLVPRSGALSRRDSTDNLRRITYCHRGTRSATSKTCKGNSHTALFEVAHLGGNK